jgi:hypothetical protein
MPLSGAWGLVFARQKLAQSRHISSPHCLILARITYTKIVWFGILGLKIFDMLHTTRRQFDAGIALGRLLREQRVWTSVQDHEQCISACIFALAGARVKNELSKSSPRPIRVVNLDSQRKNNRRHS